MFVPGVQGTFSDVGSPGGAILLKLNDNFMVFWSEFPEPATLGHQIYWRSQA